MRAWRIVLVGAALGAASIVTMGAVSIVSHVHPDASASRLAVWPAASHRDGQPIAALTAPITPGQTAVEREYGWGPFRTVDW